jgi:hypothetical protein
LVELIVVITILAILATVAFVSFQWYWVSSRDSVRLADMRSIEKWFSIKLTKGEQLPIPDEKIDITASWTLLTYQGFAWNKVAWSVWVHGEVKDPLDNTNYTYSTNPGRNKYQILWFFENQNTVNLWNTIYADFSDRFHIVKGDELWILIHPVTNQPVQLSGSNINITDPLTEYSAVLSNKSNWVVTGPELVKIDSYNKKFTSCKNIIDSYWNGVNDWIYSINPNWEKAFEVYCDMNTDWWGWTLAWRTAPIIWECLWNFWWNKSCWSPNDFNFPYSLWINSINDFSKIMIAKSNQIDNLPTDYAYVKNVSKSDLEWLKSTWFYSVGSAQTIIWNCGIVKMLDGHWYTDYWNFDDSNVSTTHDNDLFWFKDGLNNWATVYPFWMRINWFVLYWAYNWTCDSGMLWTEQWLIYIK